MAKTYDLVIVGAGPAGLSAAISGASELPRVALLDSGKKVAKDQYEPELGGQAVGSSLIENYPGFPGGISGLRLTGNFAEQAQELGAEVFCPQHADSLELLPDGCKRVTTREGLEFITKAVILANGLSYRKLPVGGVEELLGKGIMYGAPTTNPRLLGKCNICVVGGANSAGQAVMHLSQNPDAHICMLVRGRFTIEDQMSKYLVDRIYECPNIKVVHDVSVTDVLGTDRLKSLELTYGDGRKEQMEANHLFIFIGAMPKTQWLKDAVATDPKFGFIVTGPKDLGMWKGSDYEFGTSMPGVFAAGDIRLSRVKRVATAAGEGASAVGMVHRYLAENGK